MGKYLYSVIIPTFNRASFLGDALESVLLQGVEDLQLIVVDDGSTDDTRAVADSYGDKVKYIYQPNQGPAVARNHGIHLAEGEVVAFLDSDDVWVPGKIATEITIFRQFPAADAVISDSEVWEGHYLQTASRFRSIGFDLPSNEVAIPLSDCPPLWPGYSLVSTCCIAIKRLALKRLGTPTFDPSLHPGEDWEFEIRMFLGSSVAVSPKVLAKVRRFENGTREWSEYGRLRNRYEILRRVRGMRPLPRTVEKRAALARAEAAKQLARASRGSKRLRCLRLAASELREGAFASTLSVLAYAFRPDRIAPRSGR